MKCVARTIGVDRNDWSSRQMHEFVVLQPEIAILAIGDPDIAAVALVHPVQSRQDIGFTRILRQAGTGEDEMTGTPENLMHSLGAGAGIRICVDDAWNLH